MTGKMLRTQRHLVALLLVLAASSAAAAVPGSIGPQGFMLAEQPSPVPELEFKDGEGNPLTLADFRGKVILLNIWATWCPPCREEMPTLDALQAKLGGADFEVVALSIDRAGIDVVEDFYAEIGITHLRRYVDPAAMAAPILGAVGVPTTLLIGFEGRELGRLVGAAEWDAPEMVAFLRSVVKKQRKQAMADSKRC